MSELNDILDEERQLLAKLEDIRRTKAEAIRRENERLAAEKLSKPVEVVVESLTGATVMTSSDYREDLVNLLRNTRGRIFRHPNANSIPVGEWKKFVEAASTLRNVTFTFRPGVKEAIERHLNAPNWEVEMGNRSFQVFPGPYTNKYALNSLPVAAFNSEGGFYEVPFSEGWRLWEHLEKIEGVVWAEEAVKVVQDQLTRKAQIDAIALSTEDPEYAALDLNGVRLHPFQTIGAKFIDVAGGSGIIADEMGLGKTIQFIALAEKNKHRALIIVPASLKRNWAREIYKLTGKRARILSGAVPSKHDIFRLIVEPVEYTIINYDILSRKTEDSFLWAQVLNMGKFDVVAVDEAHYIKNVESNRSQALRQLTIPRYVFLTGTPVLNRPGELWAMLNKVSPVQFPYYQTFLNQYTVDGKRPRNVEALRVLLKDIMIRRLKKDVYKELPAVNRIAKYPELNEKAIKLYQRVLHGIYEMIAEFSPGEAGSQKAVTNILTQIVRLKQVCAIATVDETADLARELYEQTDESEHRKVLIFTQFKATAYAIWQRLADDGAVSFVTRDGSNFVTADATKRDEIVQEFQRNPDIKYLIVTEKTTKEGHNITAAGHVIFNDLFWTPAAHDQAIGRAYGRISDMHGVDAYFQIAQLPDDEESIADWIWELLAFKQGVIEETVEGIDNARNGDTSIQMALIEKMREQVWLRKKR